MKKYKVWVKMTEYLWTEVEANSSDEAEEIADGLDGGDFTGIDDCSWDICYDLTEEIKE